MTMASSDDYHGMLVLAFWLGSAALGLSLLLLIQVLLMRVSLKRRERRQERLLALWRPILRGVEQAPASLPFLHPDDFAPFAQLWNHFCEVLRGESRQRLNRLGYAVGLDEMALERLAGKVGEAQLLAILTLGHLGAKRAWGPLVELAGQPNRVVSITAARALVLIDADAAMPLVASMIERRDDWPLATVGAILHEAGPQVVTFPLVRVATRAKGSRKVRLIRLLKYSQGRVAMPVIRVIARSCDDPQIIAACLQLVQDRRDADVARPFLHADDWRVRVQAALAIGRVGGREDQTALVALLHDSQWWVRYRAAQSLLDLPGATRAGLQKVLARQVDPFARDMLSQVLAVRYS
jgi:hypothetical protein